MGAADGARATEDMSVVRNDATILHRCSLAPESETILISSFLGFRQVLDWSAARVLQMGGRPDGLLRNVAMASAGGSDGVPSAWTFED